MNNLLYAFCYLLKVNDISSSAGGCSLTNSFRQCRHKIPSERWLFSVKMRSLNLGSGTLATRWCRQIFSFVSRIFSAKRLHSLKGGDKMRKMSE
ncbi:MAG: hypothetical protein H7A36_04925 [Chlamydiales bacterium]|nr:hypothetical protein [Chlamydiales bacterium]